MTGATDSTATSSADIEGRLLVDTNSDAALTAAGVQPIVPSAQIKVKCRDGQCMIGEETYVDESQNSADACAADCPLQIGKCPAPEPALLGDFTQPCGGTNHGICDVATYTCQCVAPYTGEACQYCDASAGYYRQGDECVVLSISALQASEPTPAPATPPAVNRVRTQLF